MRHINGLALVAAATAVLTAGLYVRLNPTPTRFTLGFLALAALAGGIAAAAPSRVVSIGLLAAVAVACVALGCVTPSLFGLLFWAIAAAAGVALGRLMRGDATGTEQAATLGGALLGVVVPVILWWVL